MKTMLMSVLVVMAVLFIAAPAMADVIWDGTGSLLDKGYVLATSTHTQAPFSWDTPSVGFASQNTTPENSTYYKLTADGLTKAAGWQVDFGAQVLSTVTANGDYFGSYINAEDDVGGLAALMRTDQVTFFKSDFSDYTGTGAHDGSTMWVAVDMTSGTHKVSVERIANGNLCAYVDDLLVGTSAGAANAPSTIMLGDASSNGGANIVWDYVNVPEPSTLALLATGLFGLLCYAWRKRK